MNNAALIQQLREHDDPRLYHEADVLMSQAADRIAELEARTPAAPVVAEGLTTIVQNAYIGQTGEHLDAAIAEEIAKAVLAAHPVAGSPAEAMTEILALLADHTYRTGLPASSRCVLAKIEEIAKRHAAAEPMPASEAPDPLLMQRMEATVSDLKREVEYHKAQVHAAHRDLDMRRQKEVGEVWYWQHEGGNYVPSITCPIVIPAQKFRDLLAAAPVPASEKLSDTQAYRTGYGDGVRKAAQIVEDDGAMALAEKVRNLQSARVPASEAASIDDDGHFSALLGGMHGLSKRAVIAFVDDYVRDRLAAPAAPTDAKGGSNA